MRLPSLVAAAVLVLASGCGSKFFLQKDTYKSVQKAALVQYAINPHMWLGTTNSSEARTGTAEANARAFMAEFNGSPYQLMTFEELTSNPAYAAAGTPELQGFYTAPGMRYMTGREGTAEAMLTPDEAKKLCADLGVDAVVVAHESWNFTPYKFGFRAKAKPLITLNMFDKTGIRVWGDVVTGESETGMGLAPGNIIATDVQNFIGNSREAFKAWSKNAKDHLAAAQ